MPLTTFTNIVLGLPPRRRRLFLVLADALSLPIAVWLSFWLRMAQPVSSHLLLSCWLFPATLIIGLPLFWFSGQYNSLTRYAGSSAFYPLAARNVALLLVLCLVGLFFHLPMPPRSSWILLWILITALTAASRFFLRDFLLTLYRLTDDHCTSVAIYGAGKAGGQLAASLRLSGNYNVVLFIDDNPELWGRQLNNISVYPPQVIDRFKDEIDQVLIAIPSLNRSRRSKIVSDLQATSLPVLQVPTISEIASGFASIEQLRPVSIDDLLGRDSVAPNPDLLSACITDQTVCVTGAGGSIGGELCRQILRLRPKCLVLLERSEPSLYAIQQDLAKLLPSSVLLKFVLGSACDANLVEHTLRSNRVDVIFHAAAYKHVPIVELNPISGLTNNVLSTHVLCECAERCGVSRLILISTDKAVRPTNVMGATKRLAELVLQAKATELHASHVTRQSRPLLLSMVRFGNVLGSSGSVVPLFKEQIRSGGPITITHPDIIRYFMTIPEAAQLVIQAASLSEGGDLFLLDMGEPVRIKSLAEQMIRLSGLRLRDANNPTGDIEIKYTGLRPGEKLFEELLIDAKSLPTAHPLIYKAVEASLPPSEIRPLLDQLLQALSDHDVSTALAILHRLVPEWSQSKYLGSTTSASYRE